MSIAKRDICARFSSAAETYDDCALVQREIADELTNFISENFQPSSFIDVGCGTGFLTKSLKSKFPSADAVGLDFSNKMVEKAASDSPSGIEWVCADYEEYSAPKNFDLLASSSTMQWLPSFQEGVEKVKTMLSPGGCFAVSLFVDSTLDELHSLKAEILSAPKEKLLISAEQCNDAIAANGFDLKCSVSREYRRIYPSSRDFLDNLHNTGASISEHRLSKSDLKKLIQAYDERYSCEEGVYATYVSHYLLGFLRDN